MLCQMGKPLKLWLALKLSTVSGSMSEFIEKCWYHFFLLMVMPKPYKNTTRKHVKNTGFLYVLEYCTLKRKQKTNHFLFLQNKHFIL